MPDGTPVQLISPAEAADIRDVFEKVNPEKLNPWENGDQSLPASGVCLAINPGPGHNQAGSI
jgi:hypothetical protein